LGAKLFFIFLKKNEKKQKNRPWNTHIYSDTDRHSFLDLSGEFFDFDNFIFRRAIVIFGGQTQKCPKKDFSFLVAFFCAAHIYI
jgi:hypothetical protein